MKKSFKVIGFGLMMIGMLLVSMPIMAQQHEWKSTSSMQGTGTYQPQVTAVGATAVGQMATTTASYSPAKAPGVRRGYDENGNWVPDSEDFGSGAETGQSTQFPIGDAVLPMMLMAIAFAMFVYLRRKQTLKG